MGKWLVKTEPETYSIKDLRSDQRTQWDGVRNALAQQYMRQMEQGDPILIYHSGKEKAIVGLARVCREKYLDPTDEKGRAVCVDLQYVATFDKPVELAEIKSRRELKAMALVRISRLSVMPVSSTHWRVLAKFVGSKELSDTH
ncbi:EVE domain-containing protein [Candidatus Sumerlaeota bacterium]|nr:EVE domain-containing protein [Candidatus Sumerlaeota bacterium]